MKRFLSLFLAAVLLLALAACGGNVKDVQTKAVASEMYTQNDIDAAIDVIKKDFSRSWKGCTLTEISYAGDDVSREHQDWADRNNADEVLVLTSTFDVDESGASPSLNPGQTYTRWMWILVRTNGGTWRRSRVLRQGNKMRAGFPRKTGSHFVWDTISRTDARTPSAQA